MSPLKIKVLPKPVIQMRVMSRFPSAVYVLSPILLDRTGGNYTISLDVNALVDNLSTGVFQPLDSDLTAIAALTTTAYGRSLLTLANATALAAEVDSFFLTPAEGNAAYQPLDSDLTAIAALTTTSYGRAFLTLADAAAARTATGTVIGTNVQAWDADLDALAANSTSGFWARTGAGTGAARTITGTANAISVTNGNGVSGNPTLAISTDAALPGNPTTTTQAVDNSTTRIATTAYVVGQAAAATPLGSATTAVVGTSTRYARADHVHPGRETLTGSRIYYVRTDGSDSNTGLVNSSGGAFLTIQKAIDVIAALDIATYSVTISVAAGTYTGTIVVTGPWLGSGSVTLTGDTTTPSNVVLSTTGTTLSVTLGGRLNLGGFKIVSSAGIGISCAAGVINLTGNMDYGACSQGHINCSSLGQISITASYTISGSSSYHWGSAGNIAGSSLLWTLTGTPAFSTAFAYATSGGAIRTFSNTSSGSATGLRYLIDGGSSINTFGGGASYFPGGTAGSGGTTTGGGFYS